MRSGARRSLALAMAGVALAGAAPAVAEGHREPVRIGILDMQARRIMDDDARVSVVYREFTPANHEPGRRPTAAGVDHGVVVATCAVRAVRSVDRSVPIEIYSGNAFAMASDGKSYSMRVDGAVAALDWMHERGVRVVITSYNTTNQGSALSIVNHAQSLGMTMVSAASNVAGAGKVWPAADPRTISVADTTPDGSSLTLDPSVQGWVRFGFRGDYADMAKGGIVDDWGSSYASAKAGGLAAYYQSRNPDADSAAIGSAMAAVARPQYQRFGKVKATIAALDADGYAGRLRAVSAGPSTILAGALAARTAAKGSTAVAEVDVAALAARGRDAGR